MFSKWFEKKNSKSNHETTARKAPPWSFPKLVTEKKLFVVKDAAREWDGMREV